MATGTMHHVRWGTPRDLVCCAALDCADPAGWDVIRLAIECSRRDTVLIVATDERGIVTGYLVYRWRRRAARIERVAVAQPARRRGVASALLERMRQLSDAAGRTRLLALIPELDVPARRALVSAGYRAARVEREAFGHCDGYLMVRVSPPQF